MPSTKKQRGKKAKAERQEEQKKREEEQRRLFCRHGSTEDIALIGLFHERLGHFFRLAGERCEQGIHVDSVALTMLQFEHMYPDLCIDERFSKFIVAYSAAMMKGDPNAWNSDEATKARDWNDARKDGYLYACISMSLALHLMYTTIPSSKGEETGPGTDHYTNSTRYLLKGAAKRGLILIVDKHIPCNCLDSLVACAKKMKKTLSCIECHKSMPYNQMWYCKCKMPYCGRECQIEAW